jgi:4-carboxymuconolactone decarboxylase
MLYSNHFAETIGIHMQQGKPLIVVDGSGWYHEKDKPARSISKGDVIVIASNLEHWHGATKGESFTHLGITNNS